MQTFKNKLLQIRWLVLALLNYHLICSVNFVRLPYVLRKEEVTLAVPLSVQMKHMWPSSKDHLQR